MDRHAQVLHREGWLLGGAKPDSLLLYVYLANCKITSFINNVLTMYDIPSHKYGFHSYLSMLSNLFKCVIHTCKVCITFLIRYDISSNQV